MQPNEQDNKEAFLFDVRVHSNGISNVWYWGWDPAHEETGCTQTPLSPLIYSDVHYEVPAHWIPKKMWVSLLFTAAGRHPEWSLFHISKDLSIVPRKNGLYYYEVDFYPRFNDCVEMYNREFPIQGQAVVTKIL